MLGIVPCTEPGSFPALSDPSLDPTVLSECLDFNGAAAPSTWAVNPGASQSCPTSPSALLEILSWNSAPPATPTSGNSNESVELLLPNPWKAGQRAGNAAGGAPWLCYPIPAAFPCRGRCWEREEPELVELQLFNINTETMGWTPRCFLAAHGKPFLEGI